MGKLYEILGLAQYEAEKISSSPRDWLHYLDTASQLYRYSFSDTLLIHAQRPTISSDKFHNPDRR